MNLPLGYKFLDRVESCFKWKNSALAVAEALTVTESGKMGATTRRETPTGPRSKPVRHHHLGSALMLLTAHVCAQDTQEIQQVTVTATTTDQRARERETTTSIVIGHDEIMRQNPAALADVLKRQPGITIDGGIRMRGLGNGYASVLLNGLPAPANFSLESISPDLVERIEIRRAATAEFSSQAIAGSINIILRKAVKRKEAEVSAGFAVSNDRLMPTFSAQHSDRLGALSYTLTAKLRRTDNDNPLVAYENGRNPNVERTVTTNRRETNDLLELAPRFSWQASAADVLTSQTYLRLRRVDDRDTDSESTTTGLPTEFPNARKRYETNRAYLYSDLAWARKLENGSRLELKLSGYRNTGAAHFRFDGADLANRPSGVHQVESGPVESDLTTTGSYRRPLGSNHALAMGWEVGKKQRSEYRREQQWDGTGMLTRESDEDYNASVVRTAMFMQDEWDIAPQVSAYLGLRREDLHTVGAGNAHFPVNVRSGVWSPLAQLLYKPGDAQSEKARNQFRLALSRTYKAPDILSLMPRRYTVDNNNSATNPDQQGNPSLRPELAWGLDAAWEHYFGKDNMLGVSTYLKRIRDVTQDRVYQDNGAWIVSPFNNGEATVRGVELEAKLGWRSLALHGNATRNWSTVDSVPGPYNRLDNQPRLTANVGLDFTSPGNEFAAGGNFSYNTSSLAQSSWTMTRYANPRRKLDIYATWKMNAKTRLRASVSNLLHQTWIDQNVYADGTQSLSRTVATRSFPTWRLVWERSL